MSVSLSLLSFVFVVIVSPNIRICFLLLVLQLHVTVTVTLPSCENLQIYINYSFIYTRSFNLHYSCGAATWLLEMATEYPACSFTGIDISPMFPTEIKP